MIALLVVPLRTWSKDTIKQHTGFLSDIIVFREDLHCSITEFGSREGTFVHVKKSLHCLKSVRAAFCAHVADQVMNIECCPTKAEPDAWIRPNVKENYFDFLWCVQTEA